MKKLFLVLLSILAIGLTQAQAQAGSLNSSLSFEHGSLNLPTNQYFGSVRYKDLNNGAPGEFDVYMMKGQNVNERGQFRGTVPYKERNHFTVSYDPSTGNLSTSILNNSGSYNVGRYDNVNYLEFFAKTPAYSSIFLENLTLSNLDKTQSTNFTNANLGINNLTGTTTIEDFMYTTSEELKKGFIIEGDLLLQGPLAQNDASRVQVAFGHAPVPEPSTMVLGALALGGLLASRRRKSA